jgi:hypothetical protein
MNFWSQISTCVILKTSGPMYELVGMKRLKSLEGPMEGWTVMSEFHTAKHHRLFLANHLVRLSGMRINEGTDIN